VKKIFSLVMGTVFVVAFGMAYAEESMSGDMGDKVIRNDDLSHIKLDQDRATLNQMPEIEAEGYAAGGVTKEEESMGAEIEQGNKPAETGAAGADVERSGAGSSTKDSDTWRSDMNKQAPGSKSTEGSGAGGAGEGGAAKDSDSYRY
jgi:hypothetical protein